MYSETYQSSLFLLLFDLQQLVVFFGSFSGFPFLLTLSVCSCVLSTLPTGALWVRVLVVLDSWPGRSSGPVLSGSDACSVSANCGFVFQCALCFFLQARAEVLDRTICKLAFSDVPVPCRGEKASRIL